MAGKISTDPKEDKIYFHPEQVKYLEKVFPEVVATPSTTEAQLRHQGGVRSVIYFIKGRQRM